MNSLQRKIDALWPRRLRRLGWWVLWSVADYSLRLWLSDEAHAAAAPR